MNKIISLNDIGGMLNTKGGKIDTIGGAIGCISEMISKDARDKNDTTGNDIKQMKDFVCGGGEIGTLKEMIDQLNESILSQSKSISELADSMKEKKLVKDEIASMIKKATDGIEKKLDKMIDTLYSIRKAQGGNVNWGDSKKMKDNIERFKESLEDEKKNKDSRIGKLLSVFNDLKVISLKDLALGPIKLGLLNKFNDKINDFSDKIDGKNMSRVNAFIKKAPDMLKDLIVISKLSKLIKEKDFERIYKVIGVSKDEKGKSVLKESILGIVDAFSNVSNKKLKKAKENAEIMGAVIGNVVATTSILVLFSPVILVGGLLVKPLEWAFFGVSNKGDGGIIGLFKKLSEHKKDIKDANIAIGYMSLGFVVLGVGLGTLFLLTKNIEWEQLVRIVAATALMAGVTAVVGKFKDNIKEGAEGMIYLGAGIGVFGLGLGILFGLTRGIDWEQIAMVAVCTVLFGGVTVAVGALMDTGFIETGALGMAIMGAALIPFGIGLMLTAKSVKGMKWGEFGMLAATIGLFGSAVIGLGALMVTGIGAVAWVAGLAAIGALGAALIPFGIGLSIVKKVSKGVNKKDIDNLGTATSGLIKTLAGAADGKERRNARRNARLVGMIGRKLLNFSKMLKSFNEVAPDSIDKMKNSVSSVAEFFFSDEKGNLGEYSLDRKKRKEAEKNADTIGEISSDLYRLSYSLRMFNEVGPDASDKAKIALTDICDFFFVDMEKYTLNRRKRKDAEKASGTIETICDSVYKLSTGLKGFNEVSPETSAKAKAALIDIADFFFGDDGIDKYAINYRKKKKEAKTIERISDTLEKLGNSIQLFNNKEGEFDKSIDSIKRILDLFFSKDAEIAYTSKAWGLEKSLEYLGEGLDDFNDSTEDIDLKRIDEVINISNKICNSILSSWNDGYRDNADNINYSFGQIMTSFDKGGGKFKKNSKTLNNLFKTMSSSNFVNANKSVRGISSTINNINRVDVEKATKLTEMFKSFASIGKGGMFNRFDKRVKEFTNACKELVLALNGNTEAINSGDEEVTVKNEYGEEETMKRSDAELMPKQMMLLNIQELASAIADALNSMSVDCDANVNLQINNESGNEWRISRM